MECCRTAKRCKCVRRVRRVRDVPFDEMIQALQPSNNAEEADEPSLERVKLDDRVNCAYDDVDEVGT